MRFWGRRIGWMLLFVMLGWVFPLVFLPVAVLSCSQLLPAAEFLSYIRAVFQY